MLWVTTMWLQSGGPAGKVRWTNLANRGASGVMGTETPTEVTLATHEVGLLQ